MPTLVSNSELFQGTNSSANAQISQNTANISTNTASIATINSNKTASFQSTPDDVKYPTEKLVKDSLDLKANQDSLDLKANKVSSPTNGNLLKTDANGHPVDTGIPADNIYKNKVLWVYQDFSAGAITGTSVTLNAISAYSDLSFDASKIVNSAFIVRSDDLEKYVYTGATALFSSKIKVNTISGASVTLSGTPHSSYAIRIYYEYTNPFYPLNYTPPPKILSPSALEELDPIIVTQTEFENTTSTNTNGANQLLKLDGNGKIPALDGSLITNINTSGDNSGRIFLQRRDTTAESYSADVIVEFPTSVENSGTGVSYSNGVFTFSKDCRIMLHVGISFRNNGNPTDDTCNFTIRKSTNGGTSYSAHSYLIINPSDFVNDTNELEQSVFTAMNVNDGDKVLIKITGVNAIQTMTTKILAIMEQG